MADSSRITRIRFVPAPESLRASGMYGWTSFVNGDFLLDHIAVRRTAEGLATLSFAEIRGRAGRNRVPVRPSSPQSRDAIERVVIGTLRARGDIP